jgi:hypothetical protein
MKNVLIILCLIHIASSYAMIDECGRDYNEALNDTESGIVCASPDRKGMPAIITWLDEESYSIIPMGMTKEKFLELYKKTRR